MHGSAQQVSVGGSRSWLARRGPRTKIIGALALMIAVFFLRTVWAYLGFAVLLLSLILFSGLELRRLGKDIAAIALLIAFSFLFQLLCVPAGLERGTVLAVRLVFLATISTLLGGLAGPLELADGLAKLLKPLARLGLPVGRFALVIGLALRLVPQLQADVVSVLKAQRARGIAPEGSLLKRARRLLIVLIPVLLQALQQAEELAAALEARGFTIAIYSRGD